MPILVHITDEKNSARIERSGIAPGKRGVIYFMPAPSRTSRSSGEIDHPFGGGALC